MIAYLFPAFLIQVADTKETVESMELAPDVLGQDSLLGLLGDAGLVAQLVFAALILFSVFSWAVAWSKYKLLGHNTRNNTSFLNAFRGAKQLAELNTAGEFLRPASLVTVFEAGYKEVARQVNKYGKLTNAGALERSLQLSASEETSRLRQNVGWLATTASATPFIGLLGTVWGILQAFQGLGQTGGATLRAVAPGIAEALIATMFGLFAAIPALIFYNYFSNRIREMVAEMENFSIEFFDLAERNYGENHGIQDPKHQ